MPRIVLLHWKQEEVGDYLQGFSVDLYVPAQGEAMKGLKAFGVPDAFVISLDRLPSHGRDIGWHLHQRKATRQVPLLYVDGDPAKVAKIRELLPEAVYTTWNDVAEAVRAALANPVAAMPRAKSPVIGIAPLHSKLGLKEGMHIALIGAPAPFETLVPSLPGGIVIHEMPSPSDVEMTLWFVRSEEEFFEDVPAIAPLLGKKPRLWVFYRKGKGVTWMGMLEAAGEQGLAQFKVMRLDDVWAGVAFGRARCR